ncbi:MAG: hypothetical protein E7441_07015 [Ruminococcaceae bacterium]|nr:hypothetical protein [Oscillospiraceae bacterium]
MCNIAGYAGERAAAPILLEMLRAQEGFDAGYYSGIATIHEGKIYYAKLVGCVQNLIDNTDAASLPGNVGIIHGRSGPIIGDDCWAHPFIGKNRAVETEIAYVANGVGGFANCRRGEYGRLADSLMAEGYDISSRQLCEKDVYYKLSDGTTAHVSDVMCQLILKYKDSGRDPVNAMSDAFCEMPSEIVGLLLDMSEPDKIFYSRINRPMVAGFSSHGAYLSTSAIAFPDDAGEPQLLPALSSGYVCADGFYSSPYKNPPCAVAPIDAVARKEAYDVICNELCSGGRELWCPIRQDNLEAPLNKLFGNADCSQATALLYDILFSLHKEGRLKIEEKVYETEKPGASARRFILGLR